MSEQLPPPPMPPAIACGYIQARVRLASGEMNKRGDTLECAVGGCGLRAVVESDKTVLSDRSTDTSGGKLTVVRKDVTGTVKYACPAYPIEPKNINTEGRAAGWWINGQGRPNS